MFEAGWREWFDSTSGAPGAARRSPFECHPSRVHMSTRRHVPTEKGIVETILKLAIVTPLAYLLDTY